MCQVKRGFRHRHMRDRLTQAGSHLSVVDNLRVELALERLDPILDHGLDQLDNEVDLGFSRVNDTEQLEPR